MKAKSVRSSSKPTRLQMIAAGLGVAGAVFAVPLNAAADPFEAQFQKVTVGLTGDAVIGLLGRQPDAEEDTVFHTLPETRWRWNGPAGHTYVVLMIKDRVVMRKSCIAVWNC
jgi:hypothetical protein